MLVQLEELDATLEQTVTILAVPCVNGHHIIRRERVRENPDRHPALSLCAQRGGHIRIGHEVRRDNDHFVFRTKNVRLEPGDQKRIATPAMAVRDGSSFLVVGRPILEADDPAKAATDILQEMEGADRE